MGRRAKAPRARRGLSAVAPDFCPNCSSPVSTLDRFCPACGTLLGDAEEE